MACIVRCNEVSDALTPYTAVDSDEILQRLQASLVPWHVQAPATIARIHRRPDLTGPAVCLAAILVLSTALHRVEWKPEEYTHLGRFLLNLAHFAQGVAILCGYVVVTAGAMWVARSTLPGAPPIGEMLVAAMQGGGGGGHVAGDRGAKGGTLGAAGLSPRFVSAFVAASFVGYTLAPWVFPVLGYIRLPGEARLGLMLFAAFASWSFLVAALPEPLLSIADPEHGGGSGSGGGGGSSWLRWGSGGAEGGRGAMKGTPRRQGRRGAEGDARELPWLVNARAVGAPAKVCLAVPCLLFVIIMSAHLEGSTVNVVTHPIAETLALQDPTLRPGVKAPDAERGESMWASLMGAKRWVSTTITQMTTPAPQVRAAPSDESWMTATRSVSGGIGYEYATPRYSSYRAPAPIRPAQTRVRAPVGRDRDKESTRGGGRGGGGRDRDRDRERERDRRVNNAPTFARQRVPVPQSVRERTVAKVREMLKKEMDGGGGGGGRGRRDASRNRADRDRDRDQDRDRNGQRRNTRGQRQH